MQLKLQPISNNYVCMKLLTDMKSEDLCRNMLQNTDPEGDSRTFICTSEFS